MWLFNKQVEVEFDEASYIANRHAETWKRNAESRAQGIPPDNEYVIELGRFNHEGEPYVAQSSYVGTREEALQRAREMGTRNGASAISIVESKRAWAWEWNHYEASEGHGATCYQVE